MTLRITIDDIGSFPLPENVDKEKLEEIGLKLSLCEKVEERERGVFENVIEKIMDYKLKAGVDIPTYPQCRDMISSFMEVIDRSYLKFKPWVVRKRNSLLPELKLLRNYAYKFHLEHGHKLPLRLCITGPLELHLATVGPLIDESLLLNLGESVGRFLEAGIKASHHWEVKVISLDEPSLGLQPNLIAEEETLIKAWRKAVKIVRKRGIDVQIHLHSPVFTPTIYQVKGISIIGIECAEEPRNIYGIDRKELEAWDKFLRIGISRTNIFSLAMEYKKKVGVDVWKEKEKFVEMINVLESPSLIYKRLKKAYKLFGERIYYVGPDCGLSAWPTQKVAFQLLKNTVEGVKKFKEELGKGK